MALPRRLLDRLGRQLERLGQRLRRRVAPAPAPGPEPLPPEDAHTVWRAQVAHLSPEAWSVVAAPVLADGCAPIPLAPGSNRVSAWPSRAPLPSPALPTWQTVPPVPPRERPALQARIDVSALSPRPDVVQQPLPASPLPPTPQERVRWPAPRPLPPVFEPAAARPVMADPVVATPPASGGSPADAGGEAGHALPLPAIAHAHATAVPQSLAWPEPGSVSASPGSRMDATFTLAQARPTPARAPWPRLAQADSPHAPQWWPHDVSQTPAHTWPPVAAEHRWPSLPPRIEVQADAAPDLPGRLIAHRHARLTAEQRG